jgi:hypothetical protein
MSRAPIRQGRGFAACAPCIDGGRFPAVEVSASYSWPMTTAGARARPPWRREVLLRRGIVVFLLLLAVASVVVASERALSSGHGFGSTDFQWSPTKLVLEGVDPYQARLHGSSAIILTQSPNYLQLLYLVLSPFGLMAFGTAKLVWLLLNLVLAVGISVFYARLAGWGLTGSVVLASVFLGSTPMRIGLSNGQHAVFLLVFATLAFACAERWWAGGPLAVVLTKYSFAPIGLVMLFAGRIRTCIVSGVVLLAAAVAVGKMTSTGFVTIMKGPFQVGAHAVGAGAADLMTLAGFTPWFDGSEPSIGGLALLLSVVLTGLCRRRIREGDWVYALAVGSLVSLICFKHLLHDQVFLLPVVVVAVRMRPGRQLVVLGALVWCWLVVGILSQVGIPADTPWVVVVSFVALSTTLGFLATDEDAHLPIGGARQFGPLPKRSKAYVEAT